MAQKTSSLLVAADIVLVGVLTTTLIGCGRFSAQGDLSNRLSDEGAYFDLKDLSIEPEPVLDPSYLVKSDGELSDEQGIELAGDVSPEAQQSGSGNLNRDDQTDGAVVAQIDDQSAASPNPATTPDQGASSPIVTNNSNQTAPSTPSSEVNKDLPVGTNSNVPATTPTNPSAVATEGTVAPNATNKKNRPKTVNSSNPSARNSSGNSAVIPVIPGEDSISSIWVGKVSEGRQWTRYTLDAIKEYGPNLLTDVPTDISTYCPRYTQQTPANRLAFWVNLIAIMSYHESSYNPNTSHAEKFKDSSGNRVVSRGLLQLSGESAKVLGCEITAGEQLHDPRTNLRCGTKILSRYIGKDDRIFGMATKNVNGRSRKAWFGAARYWGIFRIQRVHREIREKTRALSMCRLSEPNKNKK